MQKEGSILGPEKEHITCVNSTTGTTHPLADIEISGCG